MITNEDLSLLAIRRAIFHDVPNHHKGTPGAGPTLSDIESEINETQKALLKKKLIRVLGSTSAYPVLFNQNSPSSVPAHIRELSKKYSPETFVEATQKMAKELFDRQLGAVSPGLLCVLDVAINGKPGIAVMKLERHEGAQLKLSGSTGKKTFSMSVLQDLVLTEGTRLFKSALFLRTGKGDDDFDSTACNSQGGIGSSEELTQFWMLFLGCIPVADPRVTTQRFFSTTTTFINQIVTDPIIKNDIYNSLQSELRSNRKNFSPKSFIEEYIPAEYRPIYTEFLKEQKISLHSFEKDLHDIQGKLKRRLLETTRGALISVPEEIENIVNVTDDQIVITDSLAKVK